MSPDSTSRHKFHITSKAAIVFLSLVASTGVLVCSLLLQWLVYDDWLHRTGPMHLVGTTLAAIITFVGVLRWQQAAREREQEMVRRMQMIAEMNDRIRNALQAIELVTYSRQPTAVEPVRHAVEVIDRVLRDVLAETQQRKTPQPDRRRAASAGREQSAARH